MTTNATTAESPPAGLLERVGGLMAELLGHDHWPRDRLLTYQAGRMRALLEHAVGNSRYYRDALGADAADRQLADLPTLSKADLMDNFDDIVTDHRLRRADLEAHLAGPDPTQSFLGTYRVLTSSGTTGRRGLFAVTEDEAAVWIAGSVRAGVRAGFGPQAGWSGSVRQADRTSPGSSSHPRALHRLGSPGCEAFRHRQTCRQPHHCPSWLQPSTPTGPKSCSAIPRWPAGLRTSSSRAGSTSRSKVRVWGPNR